MTLDSILNVVIPAGIFIAIGIFIYSKAKKHIDAFFETVKGWFQKDDSESGLEGSSGNIKNEPPDFKISYREF